MLILDNATFDGIASYYKKVATSRLGLSAEMI